MKINLNKQLKSLKGEDYQGEQDNLGKILADALSKSNEGNAIKVFDWAIKLYNVGEIEVDNSDYGFLVEFVEKTKLMPVICKAQILNEIKIK